MNRAGAYLFLISLFTLSMLSCEFSVNKSDDKVEKVDLTELLNFEDSIDSTESILYTNDSLKFSFKYPGNWVKSENQNGMIIYVRDQFTDKLEGCANFSIEAQLATLSLESFRDSVKNKWEHDAQSGIWDEYELLNDDPSEFKGNKCYQLLARGVSSTNSGKFNFHWKTITFQNVNTLFKLTFTSPEESFKQNEEIMSEIFDSFEFVKN